MEGREAARMVLDAAVHDARRADNEARKVERPWSAEQEQLVETRRRQVREAQKGRTKKLKEWEKTWWQVMGARATEAARTHNTAELYSILRDMKVRGPVAGRDGGKATVGNIEAELDAWKEHFRKVSETQGVVEERVWNNVSKITRKSKWLGEEPSFIELSRCVGRMKLKKAAGKDMFTVEILKYGGRKLRESVFKVVQVMWDKAGRAELGKEADEWPEEWMVGLVVPLWKHNKSKKQ